MNEAPIVKYMIMCEDARLEGVPKRLNIYGLTVQLSAPDGTFPVYMPTLYAVLALRNGRGAGMGRVVGMHAENSIVICRSAARRLNFGHDPLQVQVAPFRMRMVRFPAAGAYQFEFRYDDIVLATQSFDIVGGKP